MNFHLLHFYKNVYLLLPTLTFYISVCIIMIFNFILLLIWELNIELYILSESFWKVWLTQWIILLWTDYITALDVSHFFFFFPFACSRDKQLSGFRCSLHSQPLGGSRQPLTSCTLFLEKTSGKRSALTSVSVWKKRDVNTCEWSR